MKIKLKISLLVLLPIWLSAQCLDCNNKSKDWRFAVGATLYNNTQYGSGYIDNDYRPLEFNLRYKFNNNHVIRMSLPIVIKQKLDDSMVNQPGYDDNVSLGDYYKLISTHYAREYYQMLEHNYSLYGAALGYDYNYSITSAISAFAGVDFAYYYTQRNFNYYGISYLSPIDNVSKVYFLEYIKEKDHFYKYAIKPMAGIRYQYQKLIFEVSLGCSFLNNKYTVITENKRFYPYENINNKYSEKLIQPFYGIQQQFEYQLSLYYTF